MCALVAYALTDEELIVRHIDGFHNVAAAVSTVGVNCRRHRSATRISRSPAHEFRAERTKTSDLSTHRVGDPEPGGVATEVGIQHQDAKSDIREVGRSFIGPEG